jgi:hypothetical protein
MVDCATVGELLMVAALPCQLAERLHRQGLAAELAVAAVCGAFIFATAMRRLPSPPPIEQADDRLKQIVLQQITVDFALAWD